MAVSDLFISRPTILYSWSSIGSCPLSFLLDTTLTVTKTSLSLESKSSLGVLVRRIHIHFAIPRTHQTLVDNELWTVVDRAPHPNHFVLSTAPIDSPQTPGVQKIELYQQCTITDFYRSIFIHPQIDNFDMWKFCAMHKLNSVSQKLQTTAVACFPSTSLSPYFGWCSIGYSHGSVFGITRISICHYREVHGHQENYSEWFFRARRKNLQCLHIRRLRARVNIDVYLNHPAFGATLPVRPFSHKNIRDVDLWSSVNLVFANWIIDCQVE